MHALKTELQDWRYKMDNQVKNYKGELASLKETLSSEVQALRKELEETSDRLKRSIVSTSSVSTGHSPGLHRLPPPWARGAGGAQVARLYYHRQMC